MEILVFSVLVPFSRGPSIYLFADTPPLCAAYSAVGLISLQRMQAMVDSDGGQNSHHVDSRERRVATVSYAHVRLSHRPQSCPLRWQTQDYEVFRTALDRFG
jgi:hypothetical protein